MILDDFQKLAMTRRSVRNFKPDPIDGELLKRLVQVSHWAPSGYNLQPTHFIIVSQQKIREQLLSACMNQKQIIQAPATVVFTGDRNVVEHNLDRMVEMESEAQIINDKYEEFLRKYVSLGFERGPFGMGWLWKSTLIPFLRLIRPVPSMPVVHKSFWLAKQVMLSAMVFMLAAHSAGLATVPMEGFDETRVRKILGIPRSYIIPLLIPVGYAVDRNLKKTRLPIEEFIHLDVW